LKECIQQMDVPWGHAFLAASYGQLGQTEAALESLARFRALSSQPVDVYAGEVTWDPADRKLFLEGIALAEGKSLPSGGAKA
jgi:hypothetical protein